MAQKKRLAETFVEEGLITEAQLQKSLQRQLIMGGKIGTNLIELKYITEQQLLDFLSRKYRCSYATPDLFIGISLEVISSIPKEIAIKHKVIPLKKEQKHLTVAMENPDDIRIIDELGFMTGCKITVVVASEIGIAFGLQKYYNQPRDVRYIEVGHIGGKRLPLRADATLLHSVNKKGDPADNSEWLGGSSEEEPAHLVDFQKPKEHTAASTQVANSASEPITFQDMARKLMDINTKEHAVRVILDYISQHVENVVFLVISEFEARVWNAKCKKIECENISDIKISFESPSSFLKVKNSGQPYCSGVTSFPLFASDAVFLGKISKEKPCAVHLHPVKVNAKVVSILYIDNGDKAISPEITAEMYSIVEKLSLSFEILVLKKKIAVGTKH